MEALRVLVIDDDEKVRKSIARALKKFTFSVEGDDAPRGVVVLAAETGEEGVEMAAAEEPDLLFIDLQLPGIDGLEVLERLGASGGDNVSVLISAYASIETAVAATKRGAHDVLAKPFATEEVRAVVEKGAGHLLARRRARRLAEERRQVRYRLVRELAHELSSPLTVVQGYLDMMQERALGDGLESYDRPLERMLGRIQAMREIIEDLSELTGIESGQRERCLGDVDLEDLSLRAIEAVRAYATEHGVTVNLRSEGSPVMVADPGEIERLLGNLLTNAIKYNREGGEVTVHLSEESDEAVLVVSDTGIGISEDDQPLIFNEYYRAHTTETATVAGSGLGLAIVRRLASLYGGAVSVESRLGEGSALTARLPLHREQ